MKIILTKIKDFLKKNFIDLKEDVSKFTAKEAYFISTYGKNSSKEEIKYKFLKETNSLVKIKSKSINTSYFCCTEIPKEILDLSGEIKSFYEEQGFSVLLITEKEIKDMQKSVCLFLSWRNKYFE